MNTKVLKRVREMFDVPGVPVHVVRHNCRSWVRSVRFLGDKWLLAKQVERRA